MFTLLLHHVYTLWFPRYATFKGGAAEFLFLSFFIHNNLWEGVLVTPIVFWTMGCYSRAWKLTPSTQPRVVQKTWTIRNRYIHRYAKICMSTPYLFRMGDT
jgi:hypothetical protein